MIKEAMMELIWRSALTTTSCQFQMSSKLSSIPHVNQWCTRIRWCEWPALLETIKNLTQHSKKTHTLTLDQTYFCAAWLTKTLKWNSSITVFYFNYNYYIYLFFILFSRRVLIFWGLNKSSDKKQRVRFQIVLNWLYLIMFVFETEIYMFEEKK